MTVSEYLKGLFDFKFSDSNISSVCAKRGIDPTSDLNSVGEKELDLAQADLYLILANAVSGGGKKVVKGNRSVSERSHTFYSRDRESFMAMARSLYDKWDEPFFNDSSVQFLPIFDD